VVGADRDQAAVEAEHGSFVGGSVLDCAIAPGGGLREPRLGGSVLGAETERRGVAGPRERYTAAVAAWVGVLGTFVDGVLAQLAGDVLDLPQAEFLALVDVHAAGEREVQHRGGP
jgi:hypothetical protein